MWNKQSRAFHAFRMMDTPSFKHVVTPDEKCEEGEPRLTIPRDLIYSLLMHNSYEMSIIHIVMIPLESNRYGLF